jgi:hypothetical protein
MNTLTLKLTGYIIKGFSDLSLWGGGNACIEMDAFNVDNIDEKTLLDNINDAGFGVEKINGAICDIYENYQGTLKYIKTITVGKVSENTEDTYNQY